MDSDEFTPDKFVCFCPETEDMQEFDTIDEAARYARAYGDEYTRVVFETAMVFPRK